jgi:ABC-type spermidine/putrescine transport system permease subunit II
MAEPVFSHLVGDLVEAMGQTLAAVRPVPEGIYLRTSDGFLYAFVEDPHGLSLATVQRMVEAAPGGGRRLVVFCRHHLPLALTAVRASVERVPLALEEVARSLGRGRLSVFARIVLPLAGPGLAASFCLVFLSAVTELTATLILVPTGVQTLATQFWAYEQNLSYGQAAPFALAIIALAVVPTLVLGRYFDRLPAREAIGA